MSFKHLTVMRRVREGGMEGSVPSRGRSFLLKPGTQAPGFNRGDFPLRSCQHSCPLISFQEQVPGCFGEMKYFIGAALSKF